MIVILAIAFLYVSTVDGCSDPVVVPVPIEAPSLAFGEYTVTVTGVEQVECRGARPGEFLGLAADGWLEPDRQVGSSAVRFDLDGLMFRGGMAEGMLRVRGEPGEPEPVEATEAGPSGPAACAPDTGGAMPPAPRPSARITATVIDAHHASGVLDVGTADCSYTLNIAIEGALKDTAVVDPGGDDTGAVEPVDPGDDTGAVDPGDPGDDTGAVEPGDPGDPDTGNDDTGCG